jgi:hypothetical protein
MKPTKEQLIDMLHAIEAEEAAEKQARIDAALAEGRLRIVLAAIGEDDMLVEKHHRREHPEDAHCELAIVHYATERAAQGTNDACIARSW